MLLLLPVVAYVIAHHQKIIVFLMINATSTDKAAEQQLLFEVSVKVRLQEAGLKRAFNFEMMIFVVEGMRAWLDVLLFFSEELLMLHRAMMLFFMLHIGVLEGSLVITGLEEEVFIP